MYLNNNLIKKAIRIKHVYKKVRFSDIRINKLLKDNKSVNKYVNSDFSYYYNLLLFSLNKALLTTIDNNVIGKVYDKRFTDKDF